GEKRPNLFQGVVSRDFTGQKATERYAEELVARIGGPGGAALKQDGDGYRETLYALADLYCLGYDIPWHRMFRHGGRVHLPTYPFSRETYWVPENEASAQPPAGPVVVAALHPLLHQNTSNFTQQRFTSSFTGEEFFLADHRVNGRRVRPGVAYLEMARAAVEHVLGESYNAASHAIRFEDIAWLRPFSPDDTPAGGVARLHIACFPEPHAVSSGESHIRCDIYCDPEGGAESLLVQCHAVVRPVTDAPVLDRASLQACCTQQCSAEQCYQTFTSVGLDYGPGFRGLDTLYVGTDLALARLSLPASVIDTRFVLHPSLLDAAQQACSGLVAGNGEPDARQAGIDMPFALDAMEIFDACTPVMWAVIRRRDWCAAGVRAARSRTAPTQPFSPGTDPTGPMHKFDIDLCDETGQVHVRMQGFATRSAHRTQPPPAGMATQGAFTLTPVWDTVV